VHDFRRVSHCSYCRSGVRNRNIPLSTSETRTLGNKVLSFSIYRSCDTVGRHHSTEEGVTNHEMKPQQEAIQYNTLRSPRLDKLGPIMPKSHHEYFTPYATDADMMPVRRLSVRLSSVLHQYGTIQYNTIQYDTIQYDTIQFYTIQYNTIQYNKRSAPRG
jgi:hypothetical protein